VAVISFESRDEPSIEEKLKEKSRGEERLSR